MAKARRRWSVFMEQWFGARTLRAEYVSTKKRQRQRRPAWAKKGRRRGIAPPANNLRSEKTANAAHCLMVMELSTDFTPRTSLASLVTKSFSAGESASPFIVTIPL